MIIDEAILEQAINRYGINKQVDLTAEECGEVITALMQWKRGRGANVAEEIADALICLQQMRLYFGPAQVDEMINQKMARLRGKLEVKNVWDGA